VEVGAEENFLRHHVPSLAIQWDSHAFRMRVTCGKPVVPVT
jgi:hypothetical protein